MFEFLTKDKDEQGNLLKLGTNSVLRQASIPLYANEVYQLWNLRIGLQPDQMALMGIPAMVVMYVMMFVSCALTDRIQRRVRALVILTLASAINAFACFLTAIGPASFRSVKGIYIITIGFGVLSCFFSPFFGPVAAAVDCRAMHNSLRGRFWSIFGMLAGIAGLFFSFFGTCILNSVPYPYNFAICFGASVLLVVLAAVVICNVKELPDLAGATAPKGESFMTSLSKIFRLRVFWILMPANLLRGLGDGAGGYLAYIVFRELQLGDQYAGYTMLLGNMAVFASYLLIMFTFDRFGPGKVLPVIEVLLVFGLIGCILMPGPYTIGAFTFTRPMIFLGFYLLWKIMQQMEASAIPLAHYAIVPTEVMGNFSGFRLMMLGVTANISATAVGFCLANFSPLLVFILCAVLKLLAGAGFCYGLFACKKPETERRPPADL